MARKNAFVKISGDMVNSPELIKWLKKISHEYFTVICVGGGTQINTVFEKQGIPITDHGPLGRETKTLQEKQLARNVLERKQKSLQETLAQHEINAIVKIPILDIGSVLCHVNGDTYALAVYHGFDVIYIVTTQERRETKTKKFKDFPKIQVVAL